MKDEHLSFISQSPAFGHVDDTWAKLCCEEAIQAAEEGCYGVGAVIVNKENELVCSARNQVFKQGFQSQRHAEMELLDIIEKDFPQLDRSGLTLYVSLEPCLMCYGRILLAGITQVRYLAKDQDGGFADHWHHLAPAWKNLESQMSVKQAEADQYWIQLAGQIINKLQDRQKLRQQTVAAWQGKKTDKDNS